MNNNQQAYLEHSYGTNYHIIQNRFLQNQLAILSQEQTKQPAINELVSEIYTQLLIEVINNEFPFSKSQIETRMFKHSPQGTLELDLINQNTKVVIVDIARAGIIPSELCFRKLSGILNPDLVRQDHVYMARQTNQEGEVIGVNWTGSKIGGDKDKAIVIIPDPMGATGSSIASTIEHYKNQVEGKAIKFITMHLIVTPEYIAKLKSSHPEAIVYAARLDRGNSSNKALTSIPGAYPEEESGLNEMDYIVPGAGGLGELMNNSYC